MFTTNLQNYSDEAKWLNQTENHCVFYIPGRGIVKDANGKYFFFPLGDIIRFKINEMIDANLIADVSILQDYEVAQITKLEELDNLISPFKLHSVRIYNEDEKDYLVFASENAEDAFYKVSLDEVEKLNQDISDELLCYTEERDLENPYCIQLDDENLIFVY